MKESKRKYFITSYLITCIPFIYPSQTRQLNSSLSFLSLLSLSVWILQPRNTEQVCVRLSETLQVSLVFWFSNSFCHSWAPWSCPRLNLDFSCSNHQSLGRLGIKTQPGTKTGKYYFSINMLITLSWLLWAPNDFPPRLRDGREQTYPFFCTIMLSSALNLGCFWKKLLLCKNEAQSCCSSLLITINWFMKKYHAINIAKMLVFWGFPSESINLIEAQAGRLKKSLWGADHLRQCQNLHQLQQFKIRTFQFQGRLYNTLRGSAPYWNSFSQEAKGWYAFFIPLLAFSTFNPTSMKDF